MYLGFRENDSPWTTLKMQYRMASSIREVVSGVFYEDTLVDAPEVIKRPFELPTTIYQAIPGFRKSAVVIYNLSNSETKVSRDFYRLLVHVNYVLFYEIREFSTWLV
jgi:superfamily I DNA and/or RNA helicase